MFFENIICSPNTILNNMQNNIHNNNNMLKCSKFCQSLIHKEKIMMKA